MKKLLAVILTAAMLSLVLAGCGKSAPGAAEAPKSEEPKAEAPAPAYGVRPVIAVRNAREHNLRHLDVGQLVHLQE